MKYLLLAAILCFAAAPACARAGGGDSYDSSGGYSSGDYSSGDYSSRGYYSRGYYGRSRYRRPFKQQMIEMGLLLGVVLAGGFAKKKYEATVFGTRPERAVPPDALPSRAAQVGAILSGLARGDPSMAPPALEAVVRKSFLAMQAAWQARDYTPLKFRMMPSLYASHSAQTDSLLARGHVNMMEDVAVRSVQFVHVRCPADPAARAFTALISATARDYTIDETTKAVISGSKSPRAFQEFWTFQLLNGNWVPARIDQAGDDYLLTAPNVPAAPGEGFSPLAAPGAASPADNFYSGLPTAAAPAAAAAGTFALFQPPPPPPAAAKSVSTELDRWDRQKMEIAATLAFESVYGAWGGNDSALLKPEFVSGEALAKLETLMRARAAEGLSFEFNSLFVRRAEIVLTSPAEKNGPRPDEFTARITGSALRAMLRNGKALHRDAAAEPFTEYWVFGRQDKNWKLLDILPRMDQEKENGAQDGAPSPVQIEWYWGGLSL